MYTYAHTHTHLRILRLIAQDPILIVKMSTVPNLSRSLCRALIKRQKEGP